jgi:ubiquinone/menaquinone biosynthesis C-methylase UbiE
MNPKEQLLRPGELWGVFCIVVLRIAIQNTPHIYFRLQFSLVSWFLKAFFQLLYHRLAWGYDLVAWTVSLGRWEAWVRSVVPLIPTGRVLEIGFGPGRLQTSLNKAGRSVFGADSSQQMTAQARRRILKHGFAPRLARCRAQSLPFAPACFDSITATFPAPFIFEDATAMEIERTLKPGGKMVSLLAFRPTGSAWGARVIRAIFTLTGQLPARSIATKSIEAPYFQAGLQVQTGWHSTQTGEMLLIEAIKPLDIRSHLG